MVKNGIPYRDTIASPGSELHKAITDGNLKRASEIYLATSASFEKLTRWNKEKFEDVPF